MDKAQAVQHNILREVIMSDTSSKPSITIKKYANRRLYNTATSSYVTLEDLSVMVKDNVEFNVYDAKTSEDITRSVLTQIIVEEEGKSGQQNLLPISFLRNLIGFYGDSLQWMVPKYLEHSMQTLTGNQDQIRDYFQNTFGSIFPFGTTLEEMGKQNMAMFERTMRMFTPFGADAGTSDCACDSSSSDCACKPMTTTTNTNTNTTSSNKQTTPKDTSAKDTAVKDTYYDKSETQPTASVTSLKPRTAEPAATNTPMPNVQNATNNTGADDMQQKIANLQRQLADLAKSRA